MTTRNIVPQAAGEGSLGTAAKPWGALYANDIKSPAVRRRLLANATFYVRADGDDGNDGTSGDPDGAFATIPRAMEELLRIDAAGFSVTIDIGPGQWPASQAVVQRKHFNNWSALNIYGAGDSTVFSGAGYAVSVNGVGIVQTGNFKAACTYGIDSGNGANTIVNKPVSLSVPNICFNSYYMGGLLWVSTTVTLAGATNLFCVLLAEYEGHVLAKSASFVLADGAAFISYGVFAQALNGGRVSAIGTNSFTGNFNCKRYAVGAGGLISTGGGGANYFPGTAAGTTANGGVYA